MPQPWLTLLSWNVHGLPFIGWTRRAGKIADAVRRLQPDIVAFQEVWQNSFNGTLLPWTEPFRAAFAPSALGWGLRGGLGVLVRLDSGWQVGDVRFERYRVAAPWYRLDEGDGIAGKGILAVEVRRDGERLTIVDTHLQAAYGARRYPEVRRAQLEQLAAFVARLGDGSPVLIAGDLNTEPDEDLYDSHIASLGEDLTAEERRLRGGATCFDRDGGRREWIDYAILRGAPATVSLTRIESRAPDDPYSDHDGLLLCLER